MDNNFLDEPEYLKPFHDGVETTYVFIAEWGHRFCFAVTDNPNTPLFSLLNQAYLKGPLNDTMRDIIDTWKNPVFYIAGENISYNDLLKDNKFPVMLFRLICSDTSPYTNYDKLPEIKLENTDILNMINDFEARYSTGTTLEDILSAIVMDLVLNSKKLTKLYVNSNIKKRIERKTEMNARVNFKVTSKKPENQINDINGTTTRLYYSTDDYKENSGILTFSNDFSNNVIHYFLWARKSVGTENNQHFESNLILYGVIPFNGNVVEKITDTINEVSTMVKSVGVILIKDGISEADINQIKNDPSLYVLALSSDEIGVDVNTKYRATNLLMYYYETRIYPVVDFPSVVAGDAQMMFGLIDKLCADGRANEALEIAKQNPSAILDCYMVSYYSSEIFKTHYAAGPKFSIEDRQTGSTTRLVKLQDTIDDCALLVVNKTEKRHIIKEHGDREVLTIQDVLNNRSRTRKPILVDDANYVLAHLLSQKGYDLVKAVIKNDIDTQIVPKTKTKKKK